MDALKNLFSDDKKTKKKSRPTTINTTLNFNPTKFPSKTVLSFTILLFIIAGGLFFVSNLVPQIGSSSVRESVIESTRTFELEDEINGGLFSFTNRRGDSSPHASSTFMGISILNANLKNVKGAKEYAQRLQLSNFEDNLESLNNGVRILKILGLLDVTDFSSKSVIDRIYNQVLSHQEQGLGFKTTKFVAPTVTASFYALDTIEALGRMDEFRKTTEFSNVIQFILSQKVQGGFIEREGGNATITATYFATRALFFDSSNQETLREMNDIAPFVYEHQSLNGGFREVSEEMSIVNSVTTLEALYTIYSLAKFDVEDDSVFSEWSSVESKASAYIRSVLRGGRGVRASLSSNSIDLQSNFLFTQLVEDFPQFNFGTIPELRNILLGLSIIFALYGVFQFYKEQIEDQRVLNQVLVSLRNIFVLSLISVLSIYFIPSFSILFYLLLFTYIGTRFYFYLQSDSNTNPSDFLSPPLLTAFIHVLLLVLLNSSTHGNCFTTFYYFYIFTAWNVLSTFFSSFIFVSFTQNRKTSLYVASAFLGWVFSLIATIIYVTGNDSWYTALELIQINGQYPLLFVVLPLVSLSFSFPASLFALTF